MPIVNSCTQMIPLSLFRPIEHPIVFFLKNEVGIVHCIYIKRSGLKFQKKNNVRPEKGGALTTKERT